MLGGFGSTRTDLQLSVPFPAVVVCTGSVYFPKQSFF